MTKDKYEWLSIFKNGTLQDVVKLLVFVGIILGVYFRIEGLLNDKYASVASVRVVEEDVDRLELTLDRNLSSISAKLDNLQTNIWRLVKEMK
uniref:Uncharacterized protein n=1 Tax=viral metagenome TaxID=1070528 RepID=A0A6H1ZC92_9ZZZZ